MVDVVILCGGKGTRSYPFTEYFPKAMMPIGGTPVLVHVMRTYADQGFTSFVIAAGHRKEILMDYFSGRFDYWQVRVLDTGEDSDTGERLLRCRDYVSETFFATYSDGLGNVDLRALLAFHKSSGGLATVTSVPLRSQFGTVTLSARNRVERFEEKPVIPGCRINAGYFAFEKKVFDVWNGQNLETDILPDVARRGVLYSYLHDGFWKSMDTSKDQQELETIYNAGSPPWMKLARQASTACAAD
jgi:glucose-1-phosphate cytidylyltransferase